MCCEGFEKLFWKTKMPIITTGLVLIVANILQLVGVVSPEWDMFDTPYFGSKMRLYQNLWTIHDEIEDATVREGLLPPFINTEWKASVVGLEVSALVTGVLALVLVISTNVMEVLSMRQIFLVTCYVLAVLLACSSAVTAVFGVQLYKMNYKSILSIEAFHSFNVPIEKYVLSWGSHVSYASGGCYLLSAVLIIVNIIKSVSTTANSFAVSPSTSGSEHA
ncbi:uncharacterized protein LOC110452003 [Mizuhopecten yessoensis]|uniref:Uncharacterized protein n=1 Tax=Mizuhopecten yessoensis TaxID=6573 RepID=A0A210QKN3_MIZYE|nr:uncharacterized protein LOC110452003 [Mizuhopecten yessoensis]OWF49292.1 hypothetical protein KP79_PYT23355 [Mizuhopecten yessoensis]